MLHSARTVNRTYAVYRTLSCEGLCWSRRASGRPSRRRTIPPIPSHIIHAGSIFGGDPSASWDVRPLCLSRGFSWDPASGGEHWNIPIYPHTTGFKAHRIAAWDRCSVPSLLIGTRLSAQPSLSNSFVFNSEPAQGLREPIPGGVCLREYKTGHIAEPLTICVTASRQRGKTLVRCLAAAATRRVPPVLPIPHSEKILTRISSGVRSYLHKLRQPTTAGLRVTPRESWSFDIRRWGYG